MAEKISIHNRNIEARLKSLKDWKTAEENKEDIVKFLHDLEIGKVKGGVSCKLFYPCKNKKNKEDILIGVSARLVKFKGVNYALKVIKNLSKKYDNIKFLIIGDGPEKDNLVSQVRSLDLLNIVYFCGVIEYNRVPNFLRKLDIVLHTPIHLKKKERGSSYIHTETMGRSLCEASATGIPVVVTNVGGTSEMIINNKTGFVVKERDIRSATKKMELLIDNKNLREMMGKEGREKALKDFDWIHLFNKYKKLFENDQS